MQYDVDPDVLGRWRKARVEYLSARAALVGVVERQGWRARARTPATSYIDIVFDGFVFTGESSRRFNNIDGAALDDIISYGLLHVGFSSKGTPNYRVGGRPSTSTPG